MTSINNRQQTHHEKILTEIDIKFENTKLRKTNLNTNQEKKGNTKTFILRSKKLHIVCTVNWISSKCIIYNQLPFRHRRAAKPSRERFPSHFINKSRIRHILNMYYAMKDPIISLEQIELYLEFSELRAKTTINVVLTRSVKILIGTDFMDAYVKSIYRTERRLRPLRSRWIDILPRGTSEKLDIAISLTQE